MTSVMHALRAGLLAVSFSAAALAADTPAPQSDDQWMANLREAMHQAQAGERDRAIRSLTAMHAAAGDNLNRRGIAGLYLGQMLLWSRRGQQSHATLAQALSDFAAVREPCDDFLLKTRDYVRQAALEMRDFPAALAAAATQVECAAATTDVAAQVSAGVRLARVHYLAGDLAAAQAETTRLEALAAAPRRRGPADEREELAGFLAVANGQHAEAKVLLERRLETLRTLRRPSALDLALAWTHYARALKGLGDGADGDAALEQALRQVRNGGRHLAPWTPVLTSWYAASP